MRFSCAIARLSVSRFKIEKRTRLGEKNGADLHLHAFHIEETVVAVRLKDFYFV